MDLGIRDKVAIVTGASEGLGFAAATALAGEGVRLAVAARRRTVLESAADDIRARTGAEVLAVPCDVTISDDITRLVRATAERYGDQIHILVNNAGGPPYGHATEIGDDPLQLAFSLTLRSMIRCCRAVIPYMQRQGWGRIVTITSVSAKEPIDGLALSNTMRPAVHGFAKSLAREVGSANILVNTVCPGSFLTERHRELVERWAEERNTTPEAVLAEREAAIPVGRLGRPEELGKAIAFLASEAASYITGATLAVDGGSCRGLL